MNPRVTNITNNDRTLIESMWRDGASVKEIAERINKEVSSIYRELKRGFDNTALAPGRCGYSAEVAIQHAEEARARQQAAHRHSRRVRFNSSAAASKRDSEAEQAQRGTRSARKGC